ncbi:hypothetical protein [Actinoplanes sp. NPDC023714]|uniref:hypothetical protein n=1 Tax=Actinoplanes sp. NPDC023714 TaxID=3154322 RepID=UPI0034041ABB
MNATGREGESMSSTPILLKSLLHKRHWQTYRTFCGEYDKAASKVDPQLKGKWPSRAQLHRWLSGNMRGLPYSDHCRVLEAMFPGYTAHQLFAPGEAGEGILPKTLEGEIEELAGAVAQGMEEPDGVPAAWQNAARPSGIARQEDASFALAEAGDRSSAHDLSLDIGKRLVTLKRKMRLSDDEVHLIAGTYGHIVELEFQLDIDIQADGSAVLTYRHELFNMSDKPISRFPREIWFRYTQGELEISPLDEGTRRVAVQGIHSTPTLIKFACQISPPIKPGESGFIGYTCQGGKFVDQLYWRHSVYRYTRHTTITLRHRGVKRLTSCSSLEESPDGSEHSGQADVVWDYDGDDVLITLTRDYLQPNQVVTLRWDINRDPA